MSIRTKGRLTAVLAALVLAATALTLTPAQAAGPGRAPVTAAIGDPANDVETLFDGATPAIVKNVNVRGASFRLFPKAKVVRARIRFTDITPVKTSTFPMLRHRIRVLVKDGNVTERLILMERNPKTGNTTQIRNSSDIPFPHMCKVPSFVVNLKRNVVRIDIPVRCLRRDASRARFSVDSSGFAWWADDSQKLVARDLLTRTSRAIRLR